MSATDIAGLVVIGQGILLLIAFRFLRTFGVYAQILLETHKQNLLIRQLLAIQENELAIRAILQREREA